MAGDTLRELLATVDVLPFLLEVDTLEQGVDAALLRGVWGRSLHALDSVAYGLVFEGKGPAHLRVPPYTLHVTPRNGGASFRMDWRLFGVDAIRYFAVLLRAWEAAFARGVGRARHSVTVRAFRALDSGGQPLPEESPIVCWPLHRARWPFATAQDPEDAPCRIEFVTPVRFLRGKKQLIEYPALDLVVEDAIKRLSAFSGETFADAWASVGAWAIPCARETRQTRFKGRNAEIVRWSAAQQQEVRMRGRIGYLDLPHGPGPLWPLLAAACWTGAGHGVTKGLGAVRLAPLPGQARDANVDFSPASVERAHNHE